MWVHFNLIAQTFQKKKASSENKKRQVCKRVATRSTHASQERDVVSLAGRILIFEFCTQAVHSTGVVTQLANVLQMPCTKNLGNCYS